MSNTDAEKTLNHLGLSESAVALRLAAISLTAADREALATTWPAVEIHSADFIQKLYRRFLDVSDLRVILENESRVARLQAQQLQYLCALFCNPIDRQYVLQRISLGTVHHRIKVTPQWYLATYAHFLVEHIDLFLASSTLAQSEITSHSSAVMVQGAPGVSLIVTLFKSILFDASLVLDAYGLSEDSSRFSHDQAVASERPRSRSQEALSQPATPVVQAESSQPGMRRIRLTSDETSLRASFIGLTANDQLHLEALKPYFEESSTDVLNDFYTYLTENPAFRQLIPDAHIKRLIQQVRTYWQELLDGSFDRAYASTRMRIGVIHEKMGIEPQVYLLGLCRQAVGFIERLPPSLPHLPQVLKAFFRALIFDITFVIDAYMEARAETLLRTEGFAAAMMSGLSSAIVIIDPSNRIKFANEHFVAIVGIEPALLCRMQLADAMKFEEVLDLVKAVDAQNLSKATSKGRWGATLYRITVMHLDDRSERQRPSLAIVLDDVSQLIRTADELQQENLQHSQLADSLPALAWEMELETKTILSISNQAVDLIGQRETWLLGKPTAWFRSIHEEDVEKFFTLCATLECGQKASIDYRMIHADGHEIWVRSILQRLAKPGKRTTIAAITLDISADRMADAKRMSAIAQVSGGIAHVINNALTVIMGNIELYLHQNSAAESGNLLNHSLAACQRAASTIKQLRAFTGDHYARPTVTSLNSILSATFDHLQSKAASSLRIRTQLQPSLWNCNVDPKLAATAIDHLVTNALQAMPLGGELAIASKNLERASVSFDDPGYNRDWVEVSIADTGSGMNEEVRRRAVEPFFTTHNRALFDGLGLSFVFGFATQCGGHLLIDSQPGAGTTVRFRVPRYPEPLASCLEENPARSPKLLLVDDDELVIQALQPHLQLAGFVVYSASTCEEGLDIAQNQKLDFLVCDVLLKEAMDGVELAFRITQDQSQIGVVLISGFTGLNLNERDIPDDWEFLAKPFKVTLLLEALQRLENAWRT